MGSIIQAIFLSDLVILLIPGLALLVISTWAYTRRETAGALLGWLIGVFLIVVLSSLFPPTLTVANTPVTRVPPGVIFLATCLGLIISMGPTIVIAMVPVLRARGVTLVVAMSLSVVIGSGYLMVMLTPTMRLAVALFILAYAIGLFTLLMLNRGNETIYAQPLALDPLALDPAVQTVPAAQAVPQTPAEADIPVTALTTMERFHQARERFQSRQRG